MGKIAEYVNSKHEAEDELYKIFPKDGAIVVADIGACDGFDSARYCRMWPNSHVVAFEPRKDNFDKITKYCKMFGCMDRVTAFNTALAGQQGEMILHSSYADIDSQEWEIGNRSSSLLVPRAHIAEHPWCKFKQETVKVATLDSFALKIDYIHIDVQGAELMVFGGGKNTLAGVKAIWVEVANVYLYAKQALKQDVERFLKPMGFEVAIDTCGDRKWGDQLWVRK